MGGGAGGEWGTQVWRSKRRAVRQKGSRYARGERGACGEVRGLRCMGVFWVRFTVGRTGTPPRWEQLARQALPLPSTHRLDAPLAVAVAGMKIQSSRLVEALAAWERASR